MHDVLAALRQEHANIAQLLDILERHIAEFEAGGTSDYDAIESILDYFQSYPDLYHHPKEDLVYHKLKMRAPGAMAADLRREHEELATLTRNFAGAVRAVVDEAQVPRDALGRWARQFIDRQREHMHMEERTFFPAARRALTPEDWNEISTRMTDQEDPLFGADVGDRYEQLRRGILHWARRGTPA